MQVLIPRTGIKSRGGSCKRRFPVGRHCAKMREKGNFRRPSDSATFDGKVLNTSAWRSDFSWRYYHVSCNPPEWKKTRPDSCPVADERIIWMWENFPWLFARFASSDGQEKWRNNFSKPRGRAFFFFLEVAVHIKQAMHSNGAPFKKRWPARFFKRKINNEGSSGTREPDLIPFATARLFSTTPNRASR